MSNKLALILLGVWTLVVIAGCSGAFWYVSVKVPRHQQDERARMFGSGAGVVACIGYAAIMLPWAVAFRKRREAQQARDEHEEDEDEEDRPRRRKRPRDR